MIMETRPCLAREEGEHTATPMHMVVLWGKTGMLTILLEHDRSLGYVSHKAGKPLLCIAASRGHVGVARELLKHCPDAPYCNRTNGRTCLHYAVSCEQTEFVEFVLGSPQLGKLVNMRDKECGRTALHLAVKKCNPKMVAALLRHPDIDTTVMDNDGSRASWLLYSSTDHAKTLNWVRIFAQYV
jgi:ankyrin repeat protein